ncbi:MAG: KpsF/GutQ family sugar-phosphate isomerase [Pseudomonadota bacterium]
MATHDPDTLAAAKRVIAIETQALEALSDGLGSAFLTAVDTVFGAAGRVVVAGVGKSGHVARKISATLASTGTPSLFVHPTEASHGDLGMVAQSDVVIALSKSGETRELNDLVAYTRRFSIPLISMTAVADSMLGQAGDVLLQIPDAPEACAQTRAPTTSTTLMMALGDALAVAVLERRGFTAEDFKTFHPGGKLGAMLLRVSDLMHTGDALPVVRQGTALSKALAVMSDKRFGCVAVTGADGALAGILTDGDLLRLVANGRQGGVIDDVMTRGPITVRPHMLASAALAMMNHRKISQLIAVDDGGTPAGIVHMHDFLKAGVT